MPEGPEVRVVADAIESIVRSKVITKAVVVENVPGTLHRYSKKKPDNWDVIANNHFVINKVRTKGKLISLDISVRDANATESKWTLLITLGMSGDFQHNATKAKHARYSFVFANGDDISFIDTRCFGTIRIVAPEQASKLENKVGWDLLKAPMPDDAWLKLRLKIGNLEVGGSLLEQKHFSGLGNIYRAEVLYRTGIHPERLPLFLTEAQWLTINHTSHQILQEAYKLHGCSVADFTANGKEGEAQQILMVYGKDRCPKGHEIKTITQADRTMWFCDVCQPPNNYT